MPDWFLRASAETRFHKGRLKARPALDKLEVMAREYWVEDKTTDEVNG